MNATNRSELVRRYFSAYESKDRELLEELLSGDFVFFSPADVGIGRATYFERCWPNSEQIRSYDLKRLVELGDEVLVTYEGEKNDGSRFRNTEIFGFDGDGIAKVEVYFGWSL
jgi:ketosteroid isomerase-like protein